MLHFFYFTADNNHGDYMAKRACASLIIFFICLAGLCVRLYALSAGFDYDGYKDTHYERLVVDYLRLPITDCKGEPFCNCVTENYIAVRPVSDSLPVLREILPEDKFTDAARSAAQGRPFYFRAENTAGINNNDFITLKKYVRYSDGGALTHLTGYVDSDGNGVSGIEKAYDSYLKTDIPLYAAFSCDARGRVIAGSPIETGEEYNGSRGEVRLTADKKIQEAVESVLEKSDIKKGAVLVTDTKTGAVKAMASVPVYDRNDVAPSLEREDSPMINRAVSAYPVGSVFKAAVAAAALEYGVSPDFAIECTGSVTVDGRVFSCSGHTAHGYVDMQKALSRSCNCYFIRLAQETGYRPVLECARVLGFGESVELAENYVTPSGSVPTAQSLHSSGQLALFSFGQGMFTASTVQVANLFSAIGNKGLYTAPYAVESVRDKTGKEISKHTAKAPIRAISGETAGILKEMLRNAVREGTAENARTEGFDSAGKTATAQTGTFNPDKTEKLCTWFGGFFPADDPKYTVVILKEDGATGGEDCAPVFKEIAEKIYSIE